MKILKKSPGGRLFFSLALLLTLSNFSCDSPQKTALNTFEPETLKPWEFSIDSAYAVMHPDQFAWDLFRAINWPADTILLKADPKKQLGEPGWVVWQTWKTAPEIYLPDGSKPKPWTEKNFKPRSLDNFSSFSIKEKMPDISLDPTYGLEEVAMNKPGFDYVVENELYNLNGQLELYNAPEKTMAFPKRALEIKVKWRIIPDTNYDKARYHWQYITVKDSGQTRKELYGLVSIHITSRVLKKWLWATFEHVDNRSQKHPGDDGWLLPSRDQFACYDPPYDCERAPTNFGLEGNKWEYFLLRGTQTDYYDEKGRVSLLANSNVERGFQLSSSCITCHSLATIGPTYTENDTVKMRRIDFLPQPPFFVDGAMFGGKGYVGAPDPELFKLKGGGVMKQSDFSWSLSRAVWKKTDTTLTNQ
ncbi:MAG: hypothetical protein WBN13_12935 [Robiginitalea sp.]|uniref:hypothetical protein n=1 Tax=Robiginitalea sp. TaxID=1902411 RepID=UPI003C71B896